MVELKIKEFKPSHPLVNAGIAVCIVGIVGALVAGYIMDHLGPNFEPASDALIAQAKLATTIDTPYELVYSSVLVALYDPDNPTGLSSTSVAFCDEWFLQDSAQYNHDLARTCSVLCAIANSESDYYNDIATIDYMAEALGTLGFGAVDTRSYVSRSTVADELHDVVDGTTDTGAFTIASKRLSAPAESGGSVGSLSPDLPDGPEVETLVIVVIRGTYGSEWFSNINLNSDEWQGDAKDHAGFSLAVEEVFAELGSYIEQNGIDLSRTAILMTGHSRGGALANLIAKNLIDGPDSSYATAADIALPARRVFSYTFATPNTTTSPHHADVAYSRIFNILNPRDIVPRVPLSAWGYARYGTDVFLPDMHDDGFDELTQGMQAVRALNTGFVNTKPYREGEEDLLARFEEQLSGLVASVDDLETALGVWDTVNNLLSLDVMRILTSHMVDTYIAWMQSLDVSALRFAEGSPR